MGKRTGPRKPPRYFFEDEEPEKDWASLAGYLSGCTNCGLDHDKKDCPDAHIHQKFPW